LFFLFILLLLKYVVMNKDDQKTEMELYNNLTNHVRSFRDLLVVRNLMEMCEQVEVIVNKL